MKKVLSVLAVMAVAAVLPGCGDDITNTTTTEVTEVINVVAAPPKNNTVFLQTLASTDGDGDGDVAPGQANYWDIDTDFSLDDGSDDQFDGALHIVIDGTYFPWNQHQDELTFSGPAMGAAEGAKTVSVSDGTNQWYSAISGTYSAYLHPVTEARLQQTVVLTAATGTVTLDWTEDVRAYNGDIPGKTGAYRAALRDTSGNLLETLSIERDTDTWNSYSVDLTPYRGSTVVLSFELSAAYEPTLIDDVSITDSNATEFVTNGDFETGNLTGWTANAPSEKQNMTSGERRVEGLRVTRSFYTVPNKLWGRWVDVYENKTTAAISRTITYNTDLGSDGWGIIYSTPSTSNRALTAWDGDESDRDIGLVFGNADTTTFTSDTALGAGNGSDNIDVTYDITVPAGGKVAIVNFIIMTGTDTGRTAVDITATADEVDAAALAIVTGYRTDSQYTAGMTQEQKDAVVNF